MAQTIDSEQLRLLAEQPIGSPALQAEADRIARYGTNPSSELAETIKRASKRWLPLGRKRMTRDETRAAESAFLADQTDIEDAVEAAGGRRGGVKAA